MKDELQEIEVKLHTPDLAAVQDWRWMRRKRIPLLKPARIRDGTFAMTAPIAR